jgi:hypothetical protein
VYTAAINSLVEQLWALTVDELGGHPRLWILRALFKFVLNVKGPVETPLAGGCGCTPLHCAAHQGQAEALRVLLQVRSSTPLSTS